MSAGLFIGTSGWNYYDWKGAFYPPDMRPNEYLTHYAKHFLTTEVNYSFYHLPKPSTYQNWYAQVPDSFTFALKASRTITHIRRLKQVTDPWQQFLENASALNTKLGPILLQFPPSLRKNVELLAAFLQMRHRLEHLKGCSLAFEFRHESWFDRETCELLKKHGSALVIAHSQRYPQAPYVPTARFVYVRLHGPGALFASPYSENQLVEWAAQVRGWLEADKSVYVYFNNDFHGYAPENAKTLAQLI